MTENAVILVVDDDSEIREIVHILLEREGFVVIEAPDAVTAKDIIKGQVDLIILDIMMPRLSGFDLCKEMRKTTTVPILFLTAKSQDEDKEKGFSYGADDYLVKPFSSVELISRVKALLRRHLVYHRKVPSFNNEILIGDLCVDLEIGTVYRSGKEIPLTSMEYQVFHLLLSNRKKIFSTSEIYENVWKEQFLPLSNNTVMVHIKNLRKKLEKDFRHPQYIRTVWGKGYYIE